MPVFCRDFPLASYPVSSAPVPPFARCRTFRAQPPLQFYLRAIASQPWSDVSIITYAHRPGTVNPTFSALEMIQRTGLLGPNVVMHKV